jgi:hypothetical protein
MEINQFGKCIENPILLNSIDSSILYLDALITNTGNYIIYHRFRSSIRKGLKPIDCYEIITTDYKSDKIYISIYNEQSTFVPPNGYYFDALSDLFFKSMVDRKEYFVRKKYWFSEVDLQEEEQLVHSSLQKYIDASFGSNLKYRNFPLDLLYEKLKEELSLEDVLIEEILRDLKKIS